MARIKVTKKALAKKLGIGRSSLYYKAKKPPEDEKLKLRILAIMAEHPAYGHRRIALELKLNKKRIGRVMKKNGLKPKVRRGRRPVKPEDQKRQNSLITNIFTILCPIQPNVVWAGDFTYIWFEGRFWYLATVIEVYTREILGWHIANHHTSALIIEAFKDAVERTGNIPSYFHSDQGSEYVSGIYRVLLDGHGVMPSHSEKGSPWQNGFQESFYSNFKLELGKVGCLENVGQMIEAIHRQIAYYNGRRIHTALKMPPTVFRQTLISKQKQAAYAAI